MPRQARIDTPGALHHIMVRGIERKRIFRDNKDRDDFLARLGKILSETSTPCYAWALIPNHAHLLFRTGSAPLSHVMRRLLTGYAVRFNHRYRRHGKLFQNRYKSILCQEDPYLLELVRYIHLNPLRAGLVKDIDQLGRYRFSGHGVILGIRPEDIHLDDQGVEGRITQLTLLYAEGRIIATLESEGDSWQLYLPYQEDWELGNCVRCSPDPERIYYFDEESGLRIG